MAPKLGPKDASVLIQPRSWVPALPQHMPSTTVPGQRSVNGSVSPLSLPSRHLIHCLGIGDLAGPEEVLSGGVPRTAVGRRRGHLRKGRASA